MWTHREAAKYLKNITPALKKAGYKGRIVGGVNTKGFSTHDLDVLLTPVKEDFDFELLMDSLPPGGFTMDMETYEYITPDGKVIDFQFERGLDG
jgi:hypothetical protein